MRRKEQVTEDMIAAGTACPKCGHWEIRTRYNPVFNRLEKRCECCQYTWNQLPLDAKEEERC